jgi:endoglucanase
VCYRCALALMDRRRGIKIARLQAKLSRRELGGMLAYALTAGPTVGLLSGESVAMEKALSTRQWKGFNLVEKTDVAKNYPFPEKFFDVIKDLRFSFVRMPMDYRCWTRLDGSIDEDALISIRSSVSAANQRGLHVSVALYRTFGNPDETGHSELWLNTEEGENARDRLRYTWSILFSHFSDFPDDMVSFDILNEPGNVSPIEYVDVLTPVLRAASTIAPRKKVFIEGTKWAWTPPSVSGISNLVLSLHAYKPSKLTHYRAPWFPGSDTWPIPTWPLEDQDVVWDKKYLEENEILNWRDVSRRRLYPVHVGEFGVYNQTPHEVALSWMETQLKLWRDAGWGWALWQLSGVFGIFNSERSDVKYEDYAGMKLDRKMLELLQSY